MLAMLHSKRYGIVPSSAHSVSVGIFHQSPTSVDFHPLQKQNRGILSSSGIRVVVSLIKYCTFEKITVEKKEEKPNAMQYANPTDDDD
jgi:hypothetical protein